jgi:myo-inositol 2-dehydrogenase / D-chiro-inositol 1-dehydrogenase
MFAEAGDAATAQTLLTFDDGTLGVVSNTRYNGRGYDCRLELHGSVDTVVAGWDSSAPVRNLAPGEAFPDSAAHQLFMDRFADAYRAELSAFLDVATGRRASPCTPQEALEVAWMAEAATLSLNQHRPISMEEVRS